jgi:hypothetical protein
VSRRRIASLHKVANLSKCERRRYGRRLRLEWACQGDLEHVAGVERLVAESERIGRRRGIAPRELSP